MTLNEFKKVLKNYGMKPSEIIPKKLENGIDLGYLVYSLEDLVRPMMLASEVFYELYLSNLRATSKVIRDQAKKYLKISKEIDKFDDRIIFKKREVTLIKEGKRYCLYIEDEQVTSFSKSDLKSISKLIKNV